MSNSDLVQRMQAVIKKIDPEKHGLAYDLFKDSVTEIERLRKDRERALAMLRFVARARYDEENLRYAAECAIEEITI